MELKYEISFDTRSVYRNVYSLTDVLKDVGGLSTSLLSGLAFVVMLLNWNKDRYEFGVIMFSKRDIRQRCIEDNDIDPDDPSTQDVHKPLSVTPWTVLRINLMSFSGNKRKKCLCFKKRYEDILIKKSMQMLRE